MDVSSSRCWCVPSLSQSSRPCPPSSAVNTTCPRKPRNSVRSESPSEPMSATGLVPSAVPSLIQGPPGAIVGIRREPEALPFTTRSADRGRHREDRGLGPCTSASHRSSTARCRSAHRPRGKAVIAHREPADRTLEAEGRTRRWGRQDGRRRSSPRPCRPGRKSCHSSCARPRLGHRGVGGYDVRVVDVAASAVTPPTSCPRPTPHRMPAYSSQAYSTSAPTRGVGDEPRIPAIGEVVGGGLAAPGIRSTTAWHRNGRLAAMDAIVEAGDDLAL